MRQSSVCSSMPQLSAELMPRSTQMLLARSTQPPHFGFCGEYDIPATDDSIRHSRVGELLASETAIRLDCPFGMQNEFPAGELDFAGRIFVEPCGVCAVAGLHTLSQSLNCTRILCHRFSALRFPMRMLDVLKKSNRPIKFSARHNLCLAEAVWCATMETKSG